jgi:predicted GNAT superfamily acetyltransferase
MSEPAIQIRPCKTQEEFAACVEIQQTAWGFDDFDLVPKDIFIVTANTGGQVFGAFDGGSQVGFAIAFPAHRDGQFYLHSHMLAVLSDYRDRGIGRQLKLRQRADALGRGIKLIEWTFDPLALKNAHLNLVRLGAIVRRYIRDHYGRTSSPLHAGVPTDRLVAEWWLDSPRVEAVIHGERPPKMAETERIGIPRAIDDLRHNDPAAAERVHAETRLTFEALLERGCAATGFAFDQDNGYYLLEPYTDES